MSEMSPTLSCALEAEYGPIRAQFTLELLPEGGAPEEIRKEWLGVPLPVRDAHLGHGTWNPTTYIDFLTSTQKINKVPIRVVGFEAVDALVVAGKRNAADFWRAYEYGLFIFRGHEGRLTGIE